ncbi:VOC family protein [Roseateles sp.]|uniref:VOC family protein n=1 Tax=Roseateles sp. TaxID=1971397 RepID=UPI002E0378C7|nr:VOC family protein [Roseateles sp.]
MTLRVGNLERSLSFYVGILGMTSFRREDYPSGRFTLAFVGYGSEETSPAIELTHNWDRDHYEPGAAYGHIALSIPDAAACARFAALGVRILRLAARHPPAAAGLPRSGVEARIWPMGAGAGRCAP